MRLAWFSLGDRTSRSGHLSQLVLPILRQRAEVQVFTDHGVAGGDDFDTEACGVALHYLRAKVMHRELGFDACVYLLEDDPRCSFIERQSEVLPGIPLYLDLNLFHLVESRFSHCTDGAVMNAYVRGELGPKAAPIGDYLVRGWPTEMFSKLYPLESAGKDQSKAALVIRRSFVRRLPDQQTFQLPLPAAALEQSDQKWERDFVRRMLEIPETCFVVGFSGQRACNGSTAVLLDGLARLAAELSPDQVRLLWISQSPERALEVQRFVSELDQATAELILPAVGANECEFISLHSAADAWLFPETDIYRGPSLSFPLALSRSLPLVGSRLSILSQLPPQHALLYDVGEGESLALAESLKALRDSEELAETLSNCTRVVASNSRPEAWVDMFLQALRKLQSVAAQGLEQESAASLSTRAALTRLSCETPTVRSSVAPEFFERAIRDFSWLRPKDEDA